MRGSEISASKLRRVGELVANSTGLHFTAERSADLQRGLAGAAEELGFEDCRGCVDFLLSNPLSHEQLQVLAAHLTVGETYFFREKASFDALAQCVLPPLIDGRRKSERRLRVWSAGCCTGEEAYSLAMMLGEIIPDLDDWSVTILATDINQRFLQKAAAGVYSEWSFRGAPTHFKARYFDRTPDGRYAIRPQIKRRVTFAHLNLAEDNFPSFATNTTAMDLILCRNVLMYLRPSIASTVIERFSRALIRGGWLTVSPVEALEALSEHFVPANFPGAILHRKADPGEARKSTHRPQVTPKGESPSRVSAGSSTFLPDFESPPASEEMEVPLPPENTAIDSTDQPGMEVEAREPAEAFPSRVRALANEGKLNEALACCEEWISTDKLNASAHYLRAMISQELGVLAGARHSLQRAIYLEQDFVLAHFAMGNLARMEGRHDESDRHFRNALSLMRRCEPDEILPEAEGLNVARLREIITSISTLEPIR